MSKAARRDLQQFVDALREWLGLDPLYRLPSSPGAMTVHRQGLPDEGTHDATGRRYNGIAPG